MMIRITDINNNRKGLANYLRHHIHKGGIIVCPSRKFIYMKGAKTAGTSILRGILEKQIDDIIHQKDHPVKFENWLKNIDDDDLMDYFIFSVTRNPWDRLVSITQYLEIPLSDFLTNYNRYIQDEKIQSHSLPISLYTHLLNRPFVNMVCRFETLQSDMNLVFDRIGLFRQLLPVMNVSKHKHYSDYYQDDDKNRVEVLYQDDIRNYGYMFQERVKGRVAKLLTKLNPF